MNYFQYVRVVWARRWLVLWTFLLVAGVGVTAAYLLLPKRFVSEVTLVFDAKPDPTLGNAWQPGVDINTQIEIIKSERVAERAVKLLELESDEKALERWREVGKGKGTFEAFAAAELQRAMKVEPSRSSNLITVSFSSDTAQMAARSANALAQAYLDISVELRVAPARQYAIWFEQQASVLRADLERAQARLSKFQQERRIVGQEERVDEEIARLNSLTGQLAAAQAARAEASGRAIFSGGDSGLDVQASPVVASLKAELARAETKLSEISNIVGTNHPQRLGLEAQIAELRRQIANESRRVSGGTAAASRAQARMVAELEQMVEAQRAKVLSMRGARDEIAVLIKDVENAQRAYENARTRMSELSLQSANQQANARVLSPAVEPLTPNSKLPAAIAAAVFAGIVAGLGLAVFFEALDPRVRGIEDLASADGVPVIGVLRNPDAKVPAFRQFALAAPYEKKLLPMGGSSPGSPS
jgi:chain length determinant protein EpsF